MEYMTGNKVNSEDPGPHGTRDINRPTLPMGCLTAFERSTRWGTEAGENVTKILINRVTARDSDIE
jgi:hypothetical protein